MKLNILLAFNVSFQDIYDDDDDDIAMKAAIGEAFLSLIPPR